MGIMKGVLLRGCPSASLIDLSHDIAPQSIQQAAFVLWTAYRYFPPESVFLVVVDPGVGSARRPVAIRGGDYHFVGPDNGVFSEVVAEIGQWDAVEIAETVNPHDVLSATFHGRDLFAPAAARLACGNDLEQIGPPVDSLVMTEPPRLAILEDRIEGEVIYNDHFGNVITSIGQLFWQTDGRLELRPRFMPDVTPVVFPADRVGVQIGRQLFSAIKRAYADVLSGEATPLVGSAGQLEIGVNGGSAAQKLGLAVGDRIAIHLNQ